MTGPTQRALTLLSLLEARAVWPGPELAERLGVTTRTVRRDVDRLRELGYPVEGDHGADGGYRLGRGTRLPPLVLDDDEAVAVAVGLRQAAAGGLGGIEEDALRALAKLEQVLPSRLVPVVRAIDDATAALDVRSGPQIDPEVLTGLARAAHGRVRVRFAYRSGDGRAGARHVEPHRLLTTGRVWYLFAFDRDRDDWRTFRLDRVSDLHVTTFRFSPRPAPDAAAHLQQRLRTTPQWPVTAVVRIAAPLDQVERRIPRFHATCVAEGDASTRVTAGADDLPSLARHLALAALDLGAGLEPLSPPELGDALADVARRVEAFGSAGVVGGAP
ncbi:YafY family protein [Mariniluteicoccus endophyticus]